MDPLGIKASITASITVSIMTSITALVTVAAQIEARIKQIHAFWSSVADAPASLRGRLADIELVRDLFDGIDANMAGHGTDPGVAELMSKLPGRCHMGLETLESPAKTVLPGATENRTKITWKSAKAVLKADRLQSYKAHLDSRNLPCSCPRLC
ncbi:hypothetical protein B0T26DRAFT_259652 [Lasiosphaeria miniovina]|uniref:Fungal N-terminal domain-containing protein n=1 Tax=Lasiosphaeria miniovina TaxID=1954250 RepID=A0AA40E0G5_9PEZI|nr:uncharacterized protein B0T26DRAFT_259652 [Lasiosphaeria miniovina]KAK0723379.1 hypothetical protein B0T26DRAFT_259652 [Lasiosphaeria miniovina]